MGARNARLNNNGAWCVKNIENYEYKEKKYHIPSEYLGRYTSNRQKLFHFYLTCNLRNENFNF